MKKNNLKMCNNFHDTYASVITRILRVKFDPGGGGIPLGQKVERYALNAGILRRGAGENGVLMHIDEISMHVYKVSAVLAEEMA